MPRFDYLARDAQGEALQGVITAANSSDAAKMLRADGKFVVKLAELADAAASAGATTLRIGGRRIKTDDVIFFATQMAVMVDTGVSITEALESIIEQCDAPAFRTVLEKVLSDVQSGSPLSLALAKHPRAFKPLFVNLVRASEASGQLGTMLNRSAGYLRNQRETRRKVTGAMIYPVFLLCMSIGVVIFLLTYLMPKFTSIYAGREALLPSPTRILISVSGAVTGYWMYWTGGIAAIAVTLALLWRSPGGKRAGHWVILHVPLLGSLARKALLVRALRTLGTLIDSGVAMLDAVGITRSVVENHYFQDMWDAVDDRVQQGEQLSAPLRQTSLVPKSVTQMISAGERSGKLGDVLGTISEFLERDLDQTIKRVTVMIEPIMIFVMGAIVGSIVIALLLPIFTISRIMGH